MDDSANKKRFMKEVEHDAERSAMYQEGYADGASDGYDRAVKDVRGILERYQIGALTIPQHGEKKSAYEQMNRIAELATDTMQSFWDGEPKKQTAMEIARLQIACENMLMVMGYNDKERDNLRRQRR